MLLPLFKFSPLIGSHDWTKMVESIQDYIHALNFGYRSVLMNANVKYLNALGEIVDPHTIKVIWSALRNMLPQGSLCLPIVLMSYVFISCTLTLLY